MKLPSYIRPETVHVGDTIRVTWKVDDTERTIVGTVAYREYQGASRVLSTASEHELLRYIPGNEPRNRVTVTLLHPSKDRSEPTLFDMESN